MIIGYIITDKKMNGINILVGQVNDISLADPSKPILIVGWDKAKENEKYSSILDKQLDDNLFWTFSKTENRSDFEDDLVKFYLLCYNRVIERTRYYYINLLSIPRIKFIELCRIISDSSVKRSIYIHKSMVYVPFNGNILGISLDIAEFCKVSRKKIIDFISSNKSNKIIDDSDFRVRKITRNIENNRYIVPYLF